MEIKQLTLEEIQYLKDKEKTLNSKFINQGVTTEKKSRGKPQTPLTTVILNHFSSPEATLLDIDVTSSTDEEISKLRQSAAAVSKKLNIKLSTKTSKYTNDNTTNGKMIRLTKT